MCSKKATAGTTSSVRDLIDLAGNRVSGYSAIATCFSNGCFRELERGYAAKTADQLRSCGAR